MRASKLQGDHIFSRDEEHPWFIYYTLSKYHSQAAFSFREIDYVFKQMIMLVCSTVIKYRNKVSLVLSHLAGFKMDVIKWDMDAAAPTIYQFLEICHLKECIIIYALKYVVADMNVVIDNKSMIFISGKKHICYSIHGPYWHGMAWSYATHLAGLDIPATSKDNIKPIYPMGNQGDWRPRVSRYHTWCIMYNKKVPTSYGLDNVTTV